MKSNTLSFLLLCGAFAAGCSKNAPLPTTEHSDSPKHYKIQTVVKSIVPATDTSPAHEDIVSRPAFVTTLGRPAVFSWGSESGNTTQVEITVYEITQEELDKFIQAPEAQQGAAANP